MDLMACGQNRAASSSDLRDPSADVNSVATRAETAITNFMSLNEVCEVW